MEQDVDHGAWLEEALERYASERRAQEEIRRGTMMSLAARERFWTGVQEKIVRWRQPQNVHLRSQMTKGDGRDDKKKPEITLRELLAKRKGGLHRTSAARGETKSEKGYPAASEGAQR